MSGQQIIKIKFDGTVVGLQAATKKAESSLLAFSKGFTKASKIVTLAALGISAVALHMAGDFEAAMTRLVTGAGESADNLATVGAGTLKLMGQVGQGADAMGRALYIIESGGQHGADGLKVLRAAAEGAKAEGADLATVSDAVTSVLQDYHLSADSAALVTSKLVTAVGAGKTTMELFSASLSAVLPIASSANIPLEDVTAALASMTVHGMSAQQASENLADTIKHLLAPTSVQTKELGQLGLSSSKLADMLGKQGVTGTLRTLSELIISHMGPSGRVLLDSMNKSTDAARAADAMIRAMPAGTAALAKKYREGTISFIDWRKQMRAAPTDQANLLRQFAALQNTAGGFNELLKSGSPVAQTYQDALRRVTGDATGLNAALMLTGENVPYVEGAVRKVTEATTEAGDHVKGWAEVESTFNQRLSETKGTAEALGIKLGTALLPRVKDLLAEIMSLVDWFGQHQAVAHALGRTIMVVVGAMVAVNVGMRLYATGAALVRAAVAIAAAAQWLWNAAIASPKWLLQTARMLQYRLGVLAYRGAVLAGAAGQWLLNAAVAGVNWVVQAGKLIFYKGVQLAISAATKAWAIAQWALNVAMSANPITLIVIGIVALIAIIVLIATKTTWFQTAWRVSWTAIKAAAHAVGSWFHDVFWGKWVKGAFNFITARIDIAVQNFRDLKQRLSDVMSNIAEAIWGPFKWAFNKIAEMWNNTIGKLSWTVPDWIPGLGGKTIAAPRLPMLGWGGWAAAGRDYLVGERGPEVLRMGSQGGRVVAGAGLGGDTHVHVYIDGEELRGIARFEVLEMARGARRAALAGAGSRY